MADIYTYTEVCFGDAEGNLVQIPAGTKLKRGDIPAEDMKNLTEAGALVNFDRVAAEEFIAAQRAGQPIASVMPGQVQSTETSKASDAADPSVGTEVK